MKTNKKKVWAGVLASILLFIQKAKAIIWLVLGLLILIVGIIVVVKLAQLIKRKLDRPPPEPGQQVPWDVTRIWIQDDNGSHFWVYDNAPTNGWYGASSLEAVGITYYSLQYRINQTASGISGMVYSGTEMSPIAFTDVQGSSVDSYSFVMTGLGESYRVTCIDGVFVTEVLQVSTNTYPVIIERTTDMINWVPVFTNSECRVDSLETYRDNSPPPTGAYYRLNIQTNSN